MGCPVTRKPYHFLKNGHTQQQGRFPAIQALCDLTLRPRAKDSMSTEWSKEQMLRVNLQTLMLLIALPGRDGQEKNMQSGGRASQRKRARQAS